MNFLKSESKANTTDDVVVIEAKEDLVITLGTNTTTIGKGGGVLANLTLDNQGDNPASSVQVDFGLDGEYAQFSPTYPTQQNIALINPGFSVMLNIEAMLNNTLTGDEQFDSADVCLVFDSSGSMGEEIDSVKAEFLEITSRLSQTITYLRMGMIVYGWSKYSEYPTASTNNYIEFTDDFNAINTLINELTPNGGTEPWGDALFLANTWVWRDEVPKLLIIVGDEDCDPGLLVGVSSSESYYNGSQLLNAVTNLKEKGVKINSVITGISGIVENQFNWIAAHTGGECVNLDDLQSLPEPIDLPEIIESWTMSLTREFFVNFYANITWTELDGETNPVHDTQVSMFIIIDLAPPSIQVSYIITEETMNDFTLDVTITPKDPSGILSASLYWTDDDLSQPPEPTWHFVPLTTMIGGSYIESFTGLTEGQNFSFYITALDTMSNLGITQIYNLTIQYNPKPFGSTIEFVFVSDDSNKTISFNLDTETIGYLWIESEQALTFEFLPLVDFSTQLVHQEGGYLIYQITALGSNKFVAVKFYGDTSVSAIKVQWDYVHVVSRADINHIQWTIDEDVTNILVQSEVTDSEGGFLSVIMYDSQLIVRVHVYDSTWTKIGIATAAEALALVTGSYYFWVETVLRTGRFSLYIGSTPQTTDDPYQTVAYGPSFITILSIFSLSLLALTGYTIHRRRK
jgi:hypothetical protein